MVNPGSTWVQPALLCLGQSFSCTRACAAQGFLLLVPRQTELVYGVYSGAVLGGCALRGVRPG
jgi:hypothetical protein